MIEQIVDAKLAKTAEGENRSTRLDKCDLLEIEEAAALLNVKVKWVYRHAKDLPFAFKLPGSKMWRFSRAGIEFRESSESESESQAKKLLKKRLGEIGTGKLVGPTEERVHLRS